MNTASGTSPLVAFDDQIFIHQRTGGISRYFASLLAAMDQLGESQVTFPFAYSRNEIAERELGTRRLPEKPPWIWIPACRIMNSGARRRLRAASLVHRTYYDRKYLGRTSSQLIAYSVYDMIPELFPELFPKGNPHMAKRQHLHQADLILCISENTRRDLLELFPHLTAKIVVTPLGVDEKVFHPSTPLEVTQDPYVLFVGNRGGYKDFFVLARALSRLPPRSLRLVTVGGGALTNAERAQLGRMGLASVATHNFASDEKLRDLYAGALAFVYPSRYEGFGLPTLEAMASGCPVVLADTSSHPEVGGDAALYFASQDADDLAAKLLMIMDSDSVRTEMIRMGLNRTKSFTWERTASRTLAAYGEMLGVTGDE